MNTSMNTSCDFTFFYLKLPNHRTWLCTMLGLTAITSTLLNSLVLHSIWKTPSLHKPSYLLIANLAFTDFLNGTVVQPLTLLFHLTIIMNWKNMYCGIWLGSMAVGYWLGFVSVYTVTVMSVDRFLAIKLHNRYRACVNSTRTASAIVFGWVAIATVVFSTLFLPNLSITMKSIIVAVNLTLLLTVLTVCSSLAYYYLKKISSTVSTSNANTTNETTPPKHQNFNVDKYRHSLNTMLLVILCMLFFYLPLIGSGVLMDATTKNGQEFSEEDSSLLAYKLLTTSEIIILINSSVNPLLYLWRIRDLRSAVSLRLRKIFKRHLPENEERQSASHTVD